MDAGLVLPEEWFVRLEAARKKEHPEDDRGQQSPEVKAFLAEIVELCRKHKLLLAIDGYACGFQVSPLDERGQRYLDGWLSAEDCTATSN